MSPHFSVIIPCYNRAQSVLPTLRSVQTQTFTDFECIVVDDGSADGEALARVVADLDDPRFRYVRRLNGGPSAARNTGIDAAKGEWIAFLDSDDLFLKEKLAAYQRAAIGTKGSTVLYSPNLVDRGIGRHWVRPHRAILPDENVGEYLFVSNCTISTITIAAPAPLLRRVRFDPALRIGEDPDLCVRLAAAGAEFRMLPTPLSIWQDTTEMGRMSRHSGGDELEAWLERTAPLLTDRAVHGFRATVLAYHKAPHSRLTAFRYILQGFLKGGVPLSITVRQLLRAFLPRMLYRRLVNLFVWRAGV